MNIALLYQPRRRFLTWIAFGCAVGIHAAAVVMAASKEPIRSSNFEQEGAVVGIDVEPTQPVQEPETALAAEQLTVENEDAFPTDDSTPPPVRARKKVVPSVARNASVGTAVSHFGVAKELAMYAPPPAYPYEARRRGITGSGSVELTVNRGNGNVIEARMAQSTGSDVLDNSAMSACRNWRFRPGTVTRVIVPITYTLYGVSY